MSDPHLFWKNQQLLCMVQLLRFLKNYFPVQIEITAAFEGIIPPFKDKSFYLLVAIH